MIPPIPLHGWLILDKPLGLTSTQALGRARKILGGKKAGHGGTLDPLATGILPLAFGEATKVIPYIIEGKKTYEFTVQWGERRDTEDSEGKVIATNPNRPNPSDIEKILPQFIGDISQTPPAFSAIKIQGERAYDIARAGGVPDIRPRIVRIHNIDLISIPDADHAILRVTSGAGMYVRSLARDIAHALGTEGFVSALRRTAVGTFTLDKSVTFEKLESLTAQNNVRSAVLPIDAPIPHIPTIALTPQEAHKISLGQEILIRPQYINLLNAPVILGQNQGVALALLEPHAGSLRVLRGFCF